MPSVPALAANIGRHCSGAVGSLSHAGYADYALGRRADDAMPISAFRRCCTRHGLMALVESLRPPAVSIKARALPDIFAATCPRCRQDRPMRDSAPRCFGWRFAAIATILGQNFSIPSPVNECRCPKSLVPLATMIICRFRQRDDWHT